MGGQYCRTPSPAKCDFSIMMECTPEIGHCVLCMFSVVIAIYYFFLNPKRSHCQPVTSLAGKTRTIYRIGWRGHSAGLVAA